MMSGQTTETSDWKSSPRRRCESIHVYEDGYDVSDDVRLALARVRSTHTPRNGATTRVKPPSPPVCPP